MLDNNVLNYNSPSSIKAFMDLHGLAPQKKFGQNFLLNANTRKKIIDSLCAPPGSNVWEIGPGLGAMTLPLLDGGLKVTAFEIDRGFINAIKIIFKTEIENGSLVIIEGDCMKTWKNVKRKNTEDLFLLGNLPYNIAGTLLGSFIERDCFFTRALITIQKEVALRITSCAGQKNYSPLSVLFSYFYETSIICTLNRTHFYPPPNVDSAILFFSLKNNIPEIPPFLFPLVRSIFSRRRKTVLNNLRVFLLQNKINKSAESILKSSGAPPASRAQDITPEEYLRIAREVEGE